MTQTRYELRASDRLTLRTYGIGLSSAVEVDNPLLFGAMIAEAAWTIAREWTRRYGVPFRWDRIDWTVAYDDPATRIAALETARAVHE